MRSPLLVLLVVPFVVAGCRAQVVNEHVIGPRGDVLEELRCADVEACYDLARKECSGNFEVVQSMSYGERGGQGMMISCT